ncbi:putative cAMP-dependent protein kinase regulatory subunit [Blattamonas nauphoetae]|uniref:cAMP-dependent protein kinase regulatory subunit n=1 Tax=Blattamonas nauphoetae TaxID=2049346 RepID=A0ABQ9XL94_9EUKA|nr:putative cAMP-dependent protein kinase regulatory subunit [Blattamonas nauphoetae]
MHPMSDKVQKLSITLDDDDDQDVGEEMPKSAPKPYVAGRRRQNVYSTAATTVDMNKPIPVFAKSDEDYKSLRGTLDKNYLFGTLDSSQKDAIAKAMEPKDFPKDAMLIKQGDEGDFFYILVQGDCDVLIEKDGGSIKVATLHPNDGFGEIALMHNCPRTATIVTPTGCKTWALDRTTYKQVMMSTVLTKRKRFQDMLSKVPLFEKLSPLERHTVCDALQELSVSAGCEVVKQGEQGDIFYIIESGEVEITKSVDGAPPRKMGTMSAPQYFGEIALYDAASSKRAATVTTTTDCHFLTLTQKAFHRLLGPLKKDMEKRISEYK